LSSDELSELRGEGEDSGRMPPAASVINGWSPITGWQTNARSRADFRKHSMLLM
jgi:hypothetical protein